MQQIFKPFTPEVTCNKFAKLADYNREDYHPLFDAMMSNVAKLLKEHCDAEVFFKVWSSSMFPERVSQSALRLFEEYLENQNKI
jgi:hypothetical protein